MNAMLLTKISQLTAEEQRLLAGEPLLWESYASNASFLVEGEKFIPTNQMITLRPHTRFVAFPQHCHDYVEIMYMVTGQTVHTMETGEKITLLANELLLINRQTTHQIDVCDETDVAVNFIVQPVFFDYALEMIGANNVLGQFLIDALRNGENNVPYLHFRIAEVYPIQSLLESMVYTLLMPGVGSQRIQQASMGLLFLHLLANPQCMQLSKTVHKSNRLVVKLLQEIQQNFQTLDFADFARANHVSAAYISQTVRKATGKRCTDLLQDRRIEKAKQFLQNTNLSIIEICAAVGYSNSSYFYRLFTEKCECSPNDYRKMNRVNLGRE